MERRRRRRLQGHSDTPSIIYEILVVNAKRVKFPRTSVGTVMMDPLNIWSILFIYGYYTIA